MATSLQLCNKVDLHSKKIKENQTIQPVFGLFFSIFTGFEVGKEILQIFLDHSVMEAGRWSSGGTFYLRDLCTQADSLQRAGPIVAMGVLAGLKSLFMCFV